MDNQVSSSDTYFQELSQFYKPNLWQEEKLDIGFIEDLNLDEITSNLETKDIDRIFKEIKSSIIN
jgi:hypothetical protein